MALSASINKPICLSTLVLPLAMAELMASKFCIVSPPRAIAVRLAASKFLAKSSVGSVRLVRATLAAFKISSVSSIPRLTSSNEALSLPPVSPAFSAKKSNCLFILFVSSASFAISSAAENADLIAKPTAPIAIVAMPKPFTTPNIPSLAVENNEPRPFSARAVPYTNTSPMVLLTLSICFSACFESTLIFKVTSDSLAIIV